MSILSLITNDNKNDAIVTSFASFGIGFYLLSQNVMLWTFTLRIELTFNGSGLQYSPKLIRIIKIVLICMISLYLLAMSTVISAKWNLAYICGGIWGVNVCCN